MLADTIVPTSTILSMLRWDKVLITMDSRASQKHGNHGNRDFLQMS